MNDFFGHVPKAPIVLRDYQVRGVELLDQAIAMGREAPLFVAPTGSGKTSWAAWLIQREVERGGSALFLAPRRELIRQCSTRLRDAGIYHGVLLAGEGHLEDTDLPVQVASIDTLISRAFRRRQELDLPDFTLVIVDEAHLAVTERRKELLDLWPNATLLGLTATPVRRDGRALGMLFDALVEPTSVKALTEAGHLVPARYFSLSEPDLRKVRITAGDFNAKDLDEIVNTQALVGDIVRHWLQHAAGRRTVVFATSIAHSIALAGTFLKNGVAAEHVDAETPTWEREQIFERFISGQTQVLTNCFLASYGFDLPALSCVVLARPTKSLMLYLQMIGRGLRPAEGKTDCLVLDHAGCVHLHGFADTGWHWTLDGTMKLGKGDDTRPKKEGDAKLIDCPECFAVFSKTVVCPECGYQLRKAGKDLEVAEGELVELNATVKPLGDPKFFAELRGFAGERGYKRGWAAFKYKEKFGVMPPWDWNNDPPCTPSIETTRWIRSRQIAWAKAQGARKTA